MEVETYGFIQEAFRGFRKCLGLESAGEKSVGGDEEVVNNRPQPPSSTAYKPLSAPNDTSTTDPLVEVLSSPIDKTAITTREISTGSNFSLVTIDEVINTSGGAMAEAHYVELNEDGKTSMSLLSTRLISSGGGGQTN